MHKKLPGGRSSAPDPAGEHTALTQTPLLVGRGKQAPSARTVPRFLARCASSFGPTSLAFRPPPNPHDRFTPLNTVKSKVIRNESIKAD